MLFALLGCFGCDPSVGADSLPKPVDSGAPDDPDGDGYTTDDCDDTDPEVYPGAAEVPYDGVDQDCDGADLVDVDNDGYRAVEVDGDDCDDGNAAVHPGADEEPYDGVDQDCDGEDLIDADGDGEAAVAAGGTDCDDTNDDVHSGAEEHPGTGVDENCDGLVDWDAMTGWDADGHWYGAYNEAEGFYGSPLTDEGLGIAPDVDGDGVLDVVAVSTREIAVLHSSVGSESQSIYEAWLLASSTDTSLPTWGDMKPFRPGTIGDIDGDGLDEVVVSVLGTVATVGNPAGLVVFDSTVLGEGGAISGEDAYLNIVSDKSTGGSNHPSWLAADLDADGVAELVVGNWWAEGNHGELAVLHYEELEGGGRVRTLDGSVITNQNDGSAYLGYEMFNLGDVRGSGSVSLAVVGGWRTWIVEAADLTDKADIDDVAYAEVDFWTADWPTEGSGSDPRSVVPIAGDAGVVEAVAFYDETDDLLLDDRYWGGRVDIFRDLADGGSVSYTDADVHIVSSTSDSSGVVGLTAGYFGGAETELVVAGADGLSFIDPASLLDSGVVDIADWPRRIANDGSWICHRNNFGANLLAEDLDGDGFDDLVAGSQWYSDGDYSALGQLGIFYNRHP